MSFIEETPIALPVGEVKRLFGDWQIDGGIKHVRDEMVDQR